MFSFVLIALAAQAQSTTTCDHLGQSVTCYTYGTPAPPSAPPSGGFNAMETLGTFGTGQRAAPPPPSRYAEMKALVGVLILDGKCNEAIGLVLREKAYFLAAKVHALCSK